MTLPSSVPDSATIVSLLRRIALFETLPEVELARIAAAMTVVEYPAGTEVYREDDVGDAFYLILSGEVAVQKHHAHSTGGDTTIVRLGAGATFGEVALLENAHRTATVRVLQPCRLLRLANRAFQELVVTTLGAQTIHELLQNTAYLRRLPFLSGCTFESQARFARCWAQAHYVAGEFAVRNQGANRFHLIYDGEFEVRANGVTQSRRGPGDSFGETGLLNAALAQVDVVAIEDSRCLILERSEFLAFAQQDADVGRRMEQFIAQRLANQAGN